MKSNNVLRKVTVLLMCASMTLSYMPASFYAYAQDGAEAASAEIKTEAAIEAPQADEKIAEPEKNEAPQAKEKAIAADKTDAIQKEKTEEKLESIETQQIAKEEDAVITSEDAAQNPAAEEKSEEEKAAEEAPAPVKVTPAKNISVKYHFYQLDASGNYEEIKQMSRSVSSGKSTTAITKTTANGYVKNKKIAGDNGMVTEFTQVWKDASGSEAAFPLSMSYETAADLTQDGSNVDVMLYAQYSTHKESAKITLRFEGIRKSNGEIISKIESNTISWGGGWNFTKKKLESTTGIRTGDSFSCNGYRYTYTGQWMDQNGNIIDSDTSISLKVKDGETSGNNYFITDDITLTFTPIYEEKMVQGLDCFFIDNISTGSGSWSNKGALGRSEFAAYTHTFKDPSIATPVEHFRFLYWEKESEAKRSAAERFYDGDKYSFAVDSSLPEGTVTTVRVYAFWQPSVTVRYHYNGQTAEAEDFEGINVYDKSVEIDGVEYNGWYDAEGEKLAENAAFDAPAPVNEKTERAVYDVYARRPVTVTAATAAWTYDGQAHSDDMVEVTEGGLFEGDEIEAEVIGSITEVGKAENKIESIKIMRGDEDVSEYYDITTIDGALTVDEAPAAVTENSTPASPGSTDQKTPQIRKPAASNEVTIADAAAPMAAPADTSNTTKATTSIPDSKTPLAEGTWALINLIAAILTALGAAVAIFRRKEEEDEDNMYRSEDDADNRSRKMVAAKMAGALTGIASLIAFFITEDMSLQMALTDKYTVLMIAMLAVQILASALNKKASELENEEDVVAEAQEA